MLKIWEVLRVLVKSLLAMSVAKKKIELKTRTRIAGNVAIVTRISKQSNYQIQLQNLMNNFTQGTRA